MMETPLRATNSKKGLMTPFAKMCSSKNNKRINMLMDFIRELQAENVELKKALTLLQDKVNVMEGQINT